MNSPNALFEPSLKRILVVDDEETFASPCGDAAAGALRSHGLLIPEEGLEVLKTEAFSVIISDYQMPGMTGLDFLAQAKQLQPDATRILITAVLSLDTVIEAINKERFTASW